MNVKELIEMLSKLPSDLKVGVYGCYGATGFLDGEFNISNDTIWDENDEPVSIKTVLLGSDLCSG